MSVHRELPGELHGELLGELHGELAGKLPSESPVVNLLLKFIEWCEALIMGKFDDHHSSSEIRNLAHLNLKLSTTS